MMVIKNLRNYKFRDEIGIYSTTGFALYEDGKGFISLDGKMNLVCGAIAMISKSLKSMRLLPLRVKGARREELRVFPPTERAVR